MSDSSQLKRPLPKPEWLKMGPRKPDEFREIKLSLRERGLHTVCEEASCPNLNECWGQKTATIMILGDTCTRGCRFCHVKTGNPKGIVNANEVRGSVEMVSIMGLKYVVLTSVDRDDLPDHGAGHFARVVRAISVAHPETKVEALVPDFGAVESRMRTLAESSPFVVAQNLETVKRLTHPVRDIRAGYQITLDCLEFYKKEYPHLKTKTSLMVGLGETIDEISQTLDDLRAVDCDIVTFGQYLQPTKNHLEVVQFYTPRQFMELKRMAYKKGFQFVAAGPLVRSSYKAAEFLDYLDGKKSPDDEVDHV